MSTDPECSQFWGTNLINPDKSASPLLEQLCLGIARVIATLDPTTTDLLLPQKIATFYRSVGGNYDTLFLSTTNAGISLVYRSLGCFHSLQPTSTPFETPSIPALLPTGLVRWFTIQLLLDPDEHVPHLQEALKRFDIVNPSTGLRFPKTLPREAFAQEPDKEMTEWHDHVSRKLQQDELYMRYKKSPINSPRRGSEGFPKYVSSQPNSRRPSGPSRANSKEQVAVYPSDRRGSLPEHHTRYYGNGDIRHPMPSASMGDMRYPQGHRTNVQQDRTKSNSRNRNHFSSTNHRHSSATLRHHPSSSSRAHDPQIIDGYKHSGPLHRRNRSSTTPSSPGLRFRPQSPSDTTDSTVSSGSDISAESSPTHIPSKRHSSLFPPSSFFRHHSRRHSVGPQPVSDIADDGVRPPLPPRPSKVNRPFEYPSVPPSSFNYVQANHPTRDSSKPVMPNGVRYNEVKFRDGLFDNVPWDNGTTGKTAFESPMVNSYPPTSPIRYIDPKGQGVYDPHTASRSPARGISRAFTSGDNGSISNGQRKSRSREQSPTVTGVGGRRYVNGKSPAPIPVETTLPAGGNTPGPGGGIPKYAWD